MTNKVPTSVAFHPDMIEKLDNEVKELSMDTRAQVIRHIIRKYFEDKE